MKFRTVIVVGFLLFFVGRSHAKQFPMEVAEIISDNQIVNLANQKLILLDFWATWCGPCRPATTQLEILQEQIKNDVFIVSLTDETHETVEKYLKKNPIQLMVVRDNGGNLIKQFGVHSRPYAVLLTTKGEVIWKGHPSDITYDDLVKYSRKYSNPEMYSVDQLFEVYAPVQTVDKQNAVSVDVPVNLSVKRMATHEEGFRRSGNLVDYKGSLYNLIARIYNVPSRYIESANAKDFPIHLQSPSEIWDTRPDSILHFLGEKLQLDIEPKSEVEDVFFFEIDNQEKLWDNTQINWGENNVSNFLVGDDRIQADNMTVSEFCLLLSNSKSKTYKYYGASSGLHDWDLHIRFENLMEDELLTQYGIKLEAKKLLVTKFIVR